METAFTRPPHRTVKSWLDCKPELNAKTGFSINQGYKYLNSELIESALMSIGDVTRLHLVKNKAPQSV